MHIEILAEHLKNAVQITERTIGKNPSLPILSSFLLSVEQKKIILSSTNLEMGVETEIKGILYKEGVVAIPAKVFSSYVSTLENQEKIIMTYTNHILTIDTGKQQTHFNTLNIDEFPPFPTQHDTAVIEIEVNSLIQAFTQVLIAASPFNIKQELSTISVKTGQELILAATDSFRLSEIKIPPAQFSHTEKNIHLLIPYMTIEECIRILATIQKSKIEIHVAETSILIKSPIASIFSRLIEGKFPEYEEIIPKQLSTEVTLKRNSFFQHIKQARLFSGKLSDLTIELKPKDGIVVRSANKDIGEYTAHLDADIRGPATQFTINWKYLLDAVGGFTTDEIYLGVNSAQEPVLLQSPDRSVKHIIMPMRDVRE